MQSHDWTPEGSIAIVTGIVNAANRQAEETATKIKELQDNINNLWATVANYEEVYDMAPNGYELATDQIVQVQIPVSSGFYKTAKWVKHLNNGRIVVFHDDQGPKDTPYVANLFTPTSYSEEHPLKPMEPWLRRILAGTPTNYSILLEEVDKLWKWGYRAEVERYWKLDGECRATTNRLELLCSNFDGLQERHHQCEGCLVASRLQDKVTHIANRFSPYLGHHRMEPKGAWRCIDPKGVHVPTIHKPDYNDDE
jgi:hypothetical protein